VLWESSHGGYPRALPHHPRAFSSPSAPQDAVARMNTRDSTKWDLLCKPLCEAGLPAVLKALQASVALTGLPVAAAWNGLGAIPCGLSSHYSLIPPASADARSQRRAVHACLRRAVRSRTLQITGP
jgi:hypothetical protein